MRITHEHGAKALRIEADIINVRLEKLLTAVVPKLYSGTVRNEGLRTIIEIPIS